MINKIITKERTMKCSIDIAWWKWTTHEGLLTFFGYDNKIDLKLGGPYEIYFLQENPKGLRGGEGNTVISFLPQTMLSFTWNAPPEYPKIRNHQHKTWVVVNFKQIDEGHTEIKISHLGWKQGKEWEEVYQYFNTAWETVLDWFEKSCVVD